MKYIFILLSYFCISTEVFSQQPCPPTQNKKASGYFKDAQALYQGKKDFEKARGLVQKAIDEDPEYAEAYLLSGYLAQKKKDFQAMSEMLKKAIELCEEVDPNAYYQLGRFEYDMKKYK